MNLKDELCVKCHFIKYIRNDCESVCCDMMPKLIEETMTYNITKIKQDFGGNVVDLNPSPNHTMMHREK
jgi:hypothetical protein